MSILNKYNQGSAFAYQTPDTHEYITLKDLYKENATEGENTHQLNALFINTKSKYGDAPVGVTNSHLVNLPGHLVSNVKEMISDDEIVQLANNGDLGIEIYKYESKKWGTNYSVNFVEMLPY